MQLYCFRMRQSHFENAPGSSNFAVKKVVSTDFKFYLYLTSSVWTIWAKNWRKGNFQIDLTGQIVTKYISRVLTLCQFKSHERNNNYQKINVWHFEADTTLFGAVTNVAKIGRLFATIGRLFTRSIKSYWTSFIFKCSNFRWNLNLQSRSTALQTVFRSWKWVLRWEREVARAQPKRPPSKKK